MQHADFAGDIHVPVISLAACLPDDSGDGEPLVVQNIRHGDGRALLGQQFADRAANAERAAGHDGYFVVYTSHTILLV